MKPQKGKNKSIKKTVPNIIALTLMANLILGFSVFTSPTYAAALNDSKQLELKFENNISDSSSNAVQGVLNGTPKYVDGKVGKALQLNGTNNYIDLGTSSALQPQNLTVSFWVKPDSTLTGENMIMWNKPSGNWMGEGWYLSILSDTVPLKLSTGTSIQEAYVTGDRSSFYPVGEWTHIAVTYDNATKNVGIYRNGIAQKVSYNKQGGSIAANNTDHKYLGFNSPLYGGGYSKLNLDEFKIYSVAATDEAIRDVYKAEGGVIDESKFAQQDKDAIILPETTRGNLTFPTKGVSGSIISWSSSNTNVISNTGVVTDPGVDTPVTIQATITYGSVTLTKVFSIVVKTSKYLGDSAKIKNFDIEQVDVTDPYYVNAFNKEVEYLLKLDPDRLLSGFRTVAGLPKKAELYNGWEGNWSYLRGHTLGHYMTALSQAYKQTINNTTLNTQIKSKIDYIISELKACQNASSKGYLFATPETHFDVIEGKIEGQSWVPWYTMHKIITGLVDIYKYEGNGDALQIASKLGDWSYNRTQTWDDATHTRVLNIEYGGINDALYELYKYTNSANHLTAAHMFDEDSLFTSIVNGQDVLANKHANTQIPKFIGALNRYRTLGEAESFYLKAAENFWEMVINDHTYVTGGNSENEHFREPGQFDNYRNNINDETCNSYNMLKLTRELFRLTGNIKYANYYEKTLQNEIMSSINPETGMSTYFKPMGTGYFKVFSTEFDSFWCDTGSGMESYTKLDDSLYYHTEEDLYVNMYVGSKLNWAEKGLQLTQQADIPQSDKATFKINAAPSEAVNIKFRSPDWIAKGQKVAVTINGATLNVEAVNGYMAINRVWKIGDIVELTFPLEVQVSTLKDNPEAAAFTYGPLVLSAGLGTEQMVAIPHLASQKANLPAGVTFKDYILIKDGNVNDWIHNVKNNLVKTEGKLEFTLRNTDEDNHLKFTPYYSLYKERYGIYFYLSASDSPTFQKNILSRKTAAKKAIAKIDEVQITNDQHELAHNLQGNTGGGSFGGEQYRQAWAGSTGAAWLSYDLVVDPSVSNYISTRYYSGDKGRTFNVYVDGNLIKEETIAAQTPDQFYDVRYQIPANLIAGKTKVTVKFANRGSNYVGRLFGTVSILKDYNNSSNLQRVTVGGTTATWIDNKYAIAVPNNSTEALVKFTPENANALVYVNNILIDDTVERKVTLQSDTTNLNIRVVAEDGVTEKAYTVNINKQAQEVTATAAISANSMVNPGSSFTVGVSLNNVTESVYAQDITLSYDSNVFDYVSAASANNNIQIVTEDKATAGKVRLITANTGGGISGASTPVLNLIFKVKAGVQSTSGTIAATQAKLGVAPEGTVIQAQLGSK
ncbi:beta-L-arabinofuranosidase domain-containing protein, partial [Paenibacillus sp. 2RAB27]|uniref:beta-L-arabinofuranosidase domain-containing protein n=1 Tax=Paenibacillus sp. 2RAB27 TaxID=3232991 RepID=UPI003F981C9B